MKTTIVSAESKPQTIPEVGQAWHFKGMEAVYVRMNDQYGAFATAHDRAIYFFSIVLQNGCVDYTLRAATNIVLLQPVGGELKFEEMP